MIAAVAKSEPRHARAELASGGDHDPAVSRPEVVDDVVGADVSEAQHRLDNFLRRRDVVDVRLPFRLLRRTDTGGEEDSKQYGAHRAPLEHKRQVSRPAPGGCG